MEQEYRITCLILIIVMVCITLPNQKDLVVGPLGPHNTQKTILQNTVRTQLLQTILGPDRLE